VGGRRMYAWAWLQASLTARWEITIAAPVAGLDLPSPAKSCTLSHRSILYPPIVYVNLFAADQTPVDDHLAYLEAAWPNALRPAMLKPTYQRLLECEDD
jgi:hypothetical protein